MAQEEKVTFRHPVYRDQATPANKGVLVQVGDVVTLLLSNDGAAPTTFAATLTTVTNCGKTLGWNRDAASSDYRTSDIIRPHYKHHFVCQVPANYTTASSGSGPFPSITIGGVTYLFTTPVVANAAGATRMQNEINSPAILNGDGWAVVTNPGGNTISVTITQTKKVPNSISNNGTPILFA